MKTAKTKPQNLRVETRYYKTTNVNGAMQFQILEYATVKVTPMHERIRDYYPAETRIGKVIPASFNSNCTASTSEGLPAIEIT